MERRVVQIVDLTDNKQMGSDPSSWFAPFDDNASHAIGGCPVLCPTCNDDDEMAILRLAVRFAKRYHYAPILALLLGTLVLGIVLGVLLAPRIRDALYRMRIWLALAPGRPGQRKRFDDDMNELMRKEDTVRCELLSNEHSAAKTKKPPSGQTLPNHVAVIMDGNRRYGRSNGTDGHWEGARKLLEFSQWCLEYEIQQATVFCFSTENWKREASEVTSLLSLVTRYCAQELQEKAVERKIRVRVHTTYADPLPAHTREALGNLEAATTVPDPALTLHLCISYGSRDEIAQAADRIAKRGESSITEESLNDELLVNAPDMVIRTAGEVRLSNFLLWQAAYAELFFVNQTWPAFSKHDFERLLEQYNGRQRRFGK